MPADDTIYFKLLLYQIRILGSDEGPFISAKVKFAS
jgi:hypothetical protein